MRIGMLIALLGLIAQPALANTPLDSRTPQDLIQQQTLTDFSDCLSKDMEIAISGCTRIIDGKPFVPTARAYAYYYRGIAYERKGAFKEAIADYTESIQATPHAQAYARRGLVYQHQHDFERSIADLTEAIRRGPQYASAYDWRGLSYYSSRDNKRAIADFDAALRIDPKYAEVYWHRGQAREMALAPKGRARRLR
jgi:tetratricopeptide (TPR) repeat protein